ncbi:MAG TPA: hypothetical protein VMD59_19065 [Acidimicrobiales bacterium]|nr:hypothetical protein [Acidimicrobiales bacterium]
MPTRTLVQELCDVCYAEDGVETDSSEQLRFSWLGRDYVLLVCENHVGEVRDELQHLSDIATPDGSGRRPASAAPAARPTRPPAAPAPRGTTKTLFSQLSEDEKGRFRTWADMPTTRRIADSRVEEWIAAGKP